MPFLRRNSRKSQMLRLFILHGIFSKLCMKAQRQFKINKLHQLTTRFERIRISNDECFDEFYAKLNDFLTLLIIWVKFMINLRFLGRSKDVNSISIDELVGSL